MNGGTHYYYVDALHRQVFTNGDNARFEYDGSSLAAEYGASGALLRRYVSGPGDDEPLVWYEGSGTSDKRFLVADERGSILWVQNASGATIAIDSYDEYGIPGASNVGRFQYTGQQWIPDIGMYYYKARFYSPTLGRFLQTDPIGYAAGPNIYNYVNGDPINGIDPTGTTEVIRQDPGDPNHETLVYTDHPATTNAAGDIIVTANRCASYACGLTKQDSLDPGLDPYTNVDLDEYTLQHPPLARPRAITLRREIPSPLCGPRDSTASTVSKVAGIIANGADAVAVVAALTGAEPVAAGAAFISFTASYVQGVVRYASGDKLGAAASAAGIAGGSVASRTAGRLFGQFTHGAISKADNAAATSVGSTYSNMASSPCGN